jgi:hypothetical protein
MSIRFYFDIVNYYFAEKKMSFIFALSFWGFSSAGSEHLPYKQRVGGSNPSTPTIGNRPRMRTGFVFITRSRLAC